ncbi:di-trans,poly-cis-decaprenylcistransferase [Campylobacter sp. faydin G-140]|uniref:polyprenyl diphosphate synthase n=1 Tax=Campylobacter anatolicus TaxID=2829105 RepID=UPI001B9CA90C|nr:polyprenyl diphosphate synthase [Campylobacter anatolicus]MBR8462944.1 di-trans,poly-cis-decaprenylcistransferase [Campylobacter anatolicus]MBR8465792.1 di-trans,poly-cis-decaprenylcistransferase [Campylobacter anatolicus]
MNELRHLAIIMDGNGRWAKRQGFLRTKGHEVGANVVEKMCEFCIDSGIKILSLYAFSTENWKRPQKEVDFLMNLLKKFLISKRENFVKNGIKFTTIGDISVFSNELKSEIINLKELTKDNKKLKLNLAINYGSRDELIRAMRELNRIKLEINETNITQMLDESSDIDLLVRTGGEQRLSNFMLWQASYAELAFTQTLWPDFTRDELEQIVTKFKNKNRRFGGL